ncbi:MAG: PorP/SprF family type IX secretion system membrane protein [Bacteroidota bacterium]
MFKLITSSLFLVLATSLAAQQLPLFSQYQDNYIAINPAMVSRDYLINEENLSFGASHRNQWTDFSNSPQTQLIRGEYLYEGGGFGLLTGGYLINDQTGPTGLTGLYGRVGAILAGDPYYGGIALGLNLGLVQYRVDTRDLNLRDAGDIVAAENQMQLFPDVGFGLYYYKRLSSGFLDDDFVYAGVSIPQTIGLDTEFVDETGNFFLKRMQHFYAQAGLFHFLEDDSFVELAAWGKYIQGAPVNISLNLRYQTNAAIWVGVGGSSAGSAHAETGVQLGSNAGFDSTIRIGYGFDYNFSSFGPAAGVTHEISVSYSIVK